MGTLYSISKVPLVLLWAYPQVSAMSLGNSGSLQLVLGTHIGTSSCVPFKINVPLSKQINLGFTPVWGIIVLKLKPNIGVFNSISIIFVGKSTRNSIHLPNWANIFFRHSSHTGRQQRLFIDWTIVLLLWEINTPNRTHWPFPIRIIWNRYSVWIIWPCILSFPLKLRWWECINRSSLNRVFFLYSMKLKNE